MRAQYAVVLQPEPDGSSFSVFVPALPEAHTRGETFDTALANAREVIALCLEQRIEDGEPIPGSDDGQARLEVVSVDVSVAPIHGSRDLPAPTVYSILRDVKLKLDALR